MARLAVRCDTTTGSGDHPTTMICRLCGSEIRARTPDAAPEAQRGAGALVTGPDLRCDFCGATQATAPFLEKLKQLAQFGLTSNARLLSETPSTEN